MQVFKSESDTNNFEDACSSRSVARTGNLEQHKLLLFNNYKIILFLCLQHNI